MHLKLDENSITRVCARHRTHDSSTCSDGVSKVDSLVPFSFLGPLSSSVLGRRDNENLVQRIRLEEAGISRQAWATEQEGPWPATSEVGSCIFTCSNPMLPALRRIRKTQMLCTFRLNRFQRLSLHCCWIST